MHPVLTYEKYIELDAAQPLETIRHTLSIKHNTKTGRYTLTGFWHGSLIKVEAHNFRQLREETKERYRLSIPRLKDFLFTPARLNFRFAFMQGHIPGYSCMIDLTERKKDNRTEAEHP